MDKSQEPANQGQPAERPVFEALLYPHRSLRSRGFLILTTGTLVIVAAYGGLFLVLGAWPIFGFLGAEWARCSGGCCAPTSAATAGPSEERPNARDRDRRRVHHVHTVGQSPGLRLTPPRLALRHG